MVSGLQRLRERFEAILLDLDGTLLDGRSELTPRTVSAIAALEAAGFHVMLCTGRSPAGTIPFYEQLGLKTAIAVYNGSWIGHPDQDPQHYIPIPDVHLEALFATEQHADFSFRHRAGWKYTVMTEHPEHHQVAAWFENVVRADGNQELPTYDILRLSMFFDSDAFGGQARDDVSARDLLWQKIPPHAREGLRAEIFPLSMFPQYASSTLHLVEVQGDSKGKAETFEYLERHYGIPAERTIAVGDHYNDLTMLEGAGLAVVPASGIPEARARADVLVGHHARHGVAEWIEQGAPVGCTLP
jgi:hydroxymethylpyrimidine pyrophosphatase-like HAD family hydrolase